MKKFKKLLIISLIFMIITNVIICLEDNKVTSVNANVTAEIVMERDSLRILKSRNENVKLPIASLTKIVTAITVIENSSLFDEVVITKESVGIEGSSIYLKEGEVCTVEELLYGLMMRSGNDSACALALHCGKTIENFAKMMNITARNCGACDSNFVNPHGLNDAEHYSTANDLALISCHALQNEVFKKIVSTSKITFKNRTFVNKNKMLNSYEGANGIKTGYTKKAGRCLVTGAEKNGMQLVSVVLNCGPMYERSKELLDECFGAYKLTKVLSAGEKVGEIGLCNCPSEGKTFDVVLDKPIYLPLTESEKSKTEISFDGEKSADYPVARGKYVGKICVSIDKDLIFSAKLYSIYSDNGLSYGETLKGVFARWSVYEN